MLGKGCERKCEALGQAELSRSVFPSSWTTFRNTLKELHKQQTEGQGTLLPEEKGCLPPGDGISPSQCSPPL